MNLGPPITERERETDRQTDKQWVQEVLSLAVKTTTHLCLVSRSRICGSVYSVPIHSHGSLPN
jgi:hypothetical protein